MRIINQASAFAIAAHSAIGQRRKYTEEPYWHHCREVARLIWRNSRPSTNNDEDVILDKIVAAAWLHDTVEDTKVTLADIGFVFGSEVQSLVEMVTDISKPEDGNRETRKRLDREHLAEASPHGKTIKLADLIDNTKSIATYDPDFAVQYLKEKELLLPLLREGDENLYRMAEESLRWGQEQLVQHALGRARAI